MLMAFHRREKYLRHNDEVKRLKLTYLPLTLLAYAGTLNWKYYIDLLTAGYIIHGS